MDEAKEVSRRVVRYEGPPPFSRVLVNDLEALGLEVEWEPPYFQGGAGGVMEQVVVPLLVTGAYDAIKAGVRLFRDRYPRGTVPIEEERREAAIEVTIEEEEDDAGDGP